MLINCTNAARIQVENTQYTQNIFMEIKKIKKQLKYYVHPPIGLEITYPDNRSQWAAHNTAVLFVIRSIIN